jgi:N-acetylneuraminic acid mutarotase
VLVSGKVLVAGGAITASAEVYDPATAKWQSTGPMTRVRSHHAAVLLPSGMVFVTGGSGDTSAELYDPVANSWRSTEPMSTIQANPQAVLLTDGRVLVVGIVQSQPSDPTAGPAEFYHPGPETWSPAPAEPIGRRSAAALLMRSGAVMVMGGYAWEDHSYPGVDVYDPATNAWKRTPPLPTSCMSLTATLLPSGKVVVTGGEHQTEGFFWDLDSTLTYDPATGTWSSSANMSIARSGHAATLLHSGLVLVEGGWSAPYTDDGPPYYGSIVSSAEIFDGNSWASATSMAVPRLNHTATVLASGGVLVVGGDDGGTVEEYTPY